MRESIKEVRYHVMEITSIAAFAGIRGGFRENCKDVYFVRAVGVSKTLQAEILQMDEQLSKKAESGQCRYYRPGRMAGLPGAAEAARYAEMYMQWKSTGKRYLSYREAQEDFCETLGTALKETLSLYRREHASATDTMEKNFAVKLLYWLEQLTAGVEENWTPQLMVKVALQDISGRQEYLFGYFLTRLGMDVLLLQCAVDIQEPLQRLGLSGKMQLGALQACEIPTYDRQKYRRERETARAARFQENTQAQTRSNPHTDARPVVHLPERRRNRPSAVLARQNTASHEAACAAAGNQARREKSFEELALLASSVVMIVIHDKDGEVVGTGSGIMIGEDGYILTNNHVAGGGRSYTIRVEDEEEAYWTDEVIKYNSVLDLAILRVRRRLQPLPVYRGSQKLVRGQKVVAIGSPLGLFNSVSDGIISGFRVMDGVDMIQFTAPISHGSSGGAVLNMYGEVIGISTGGFDDGQNINLAVGYESIFMFCRGFA